MDIDIEYYCSGQVMATASKRRRSADTIKYPLSSGEEEEYKDDDASADEGNGLGDDLAASDEEEQEDEEAETQGSGDSKAKKKRGRKPGSTAAVLAAKKGIACAAGSSKATAGKGTTTAQAIDKTKGAKVKKGKCFIKGDNKWCRPCREWHHVDTFPTGSATCAITRKIIQNVTTRCKDDPKKKEWWRRTQEDEHALNKVIKTYRQKLELFGGKHRKVKFPVAQYMERVRRERLLWDESNTAVKWHVHSRNQSAYN